MIRLKKKLILLSGIFILCLLAGVVVAYIAFEPESEQSVAQKISGNISSELLRVQQDVDLIKTSLGDPGAVSNQTAYPFFVYENDSLSFWSDHHVVPPPEMARDTFDVRMIKTGGDVYLLSKSSQPNHIAIVSLIPLHKNYIIRNDYLSFQYNKKIFSSSSVSIYDVGAQAGEPVCIGDNCLFRIHTGTEFYANAATKVTGILLFVITLMVFVAIVYTALPLITKKYPELGVPYLYLSFLGIRWAMIYFDFPNRFYPGTLFDPLLFASSPLNTSLGDLLLNILALLAVCHFIFTNYFRFRFVEFFRLKKWRWVSAIFASLCILFASIFPYVVIQTIYNNSSIVLDIAESLRFDSLRIVALIVVLISGICFFLFSHPFMRLLAGDRNYARSVASFLIGIGVFAVINEITRQNYWSSVAMCSIYFLTVYAFQLTRSLKRLSYSTFSYLFIATFCISISGAIGIYHFSKKEKIESQFRFASNFLIDRDIFGEYLLHEASQKIANDAFTQARIVTPFLGTEAIGQKIRQVFLPTYFNKYDVEIFIFNASGDPVGNQLAPTFAEMVKRYDADPYRTSYSEIYFVNNPETDVTQKYLIVVPVYRSSAIAGYVVVELSLKKIIPENVYPELLVDYRFQQFYRTQDISYTVFTNDAFVFTSGDFNFEKYFSRSMMGNTKLYTEGWTAFGYDHIAQEDQNGRVAIVSTKESPISYRAANFSFLFVLGLLVILMLVFIQGIVNYFRGRRLFFSARIQLYLNLAFFVPLIIVSVSIVSLTTKSSQDQLDREYIDKSRVFSQEINSYLDDYLFRNMDNAVSFNNRLSELANLSNLDANIYSPDGLLLSTSQPLVFESHLLSPFINSEAFEKIKNNERYFIQSEQVGKLNYFIAYTAIKSTQTGDVIGILAIPFFQSAYLLERAQIVILTNILNIFAFIFILLLILSYFVSEWLTFPLRFITQSLRRTSLTKLNKPLTWSTNDEIGIMVKEYNSMLYKLGESKNQLEQTQREKAWREIAQQVAHEIKNPLTPMKLTLQQLQRNLEASNGSVEKSQKAITMLLGQVDTLNDIASSFSGFAKMPEPVIKKLELVSAVRNAVDLHSASAEVNFKSSAKEIFILGDEQMLNRTFSNIILNGLQSEVPGRAIRMNVSISIKNSAAFIEFQDNGKGIDPSIAELVFLPHFSTKKSGSGIGLAISKQGIELMNGKIWFETKPGAGTSFFIELPVSQNG